VPILKQRLAGYPQWCFNFFTLQFLQQSVILPKERVMAAVSSTKSSPPAGAGKQEVKPQEPKKRGALAVNNKPVTANGGATAKANSGTTGSRSPQPEKSNSSLADKKAAAPKETNPKANSDSKFTVATGATGTPSTKPSKSPPTSPLTTAARVVGGLLTAASGGAAVAQSAPSATAGTAGATNPAAPNNPSSTSSANGAAQPERPPIGNSGFRILKTKGNSVTEVADSNGTVYRLNAGKLTPAKPVTPQTSPTSGAADQGRTVNPTGQNPSGQPQQAPGTSTNRPGASTQTTDGRQPGSPNSAPKGGANTPVPSAETNRAPGSDSSAKPTSPTATPPSVAPENRSVNANDGTATSQATDKNNADKNILTNPPQWLTEPSAKVPGAAPTAPSEGRTPSASPAPSPAPESNNAPGGDRSSETTSATETPPTAAEFVKGNVLMEAGVGVATRLIPYGRVPKQIQGAIPWMGALAEGGLRAEKWNAAQLSALNDPEVKSNDKVLKTGVAAFAISNGLERPLEQAAVWGGKLALKAPGAQKVLPLATKLHPLVGPVAAGAAAYVGAEYAKESVNAIDNSPSPIRAAAALATVQSLHGYAKTTGSFMQEMGVETAQEAIKKSAEAKVAWNASTAAFPKTRAAVDGIAGGILKGAAGAAEVVTNIYNRVAGPNHQASSKAVDLLKASAGRAFDSAKSNFQTPDFVTHRLGLLFKKPLGAWRGPWAGASTGIGKGLSALGGTTAKKWIGPVGAVVHGLTSGENKIGRTIGAVGGYFGGGAVGAAGGGLFGTAIPIPIVGTVSGVTIGAFTGAAIGTGMGSDLGAQVQQAVEDRTGWNLP
jgi:hypothetical protein